MNSSPTALKHGFPDGRAGAIQVSMEHQNGQYTLTVTDNGIGLPAALNLHTTTSLGFKLVLALANQLSGHLTYESHGGTRFRITFADDSVGEPSVAYHGLVRDQRRHTSPGLTADGDVVADHQQEAVGSPTWDHTSFRAAFTKSADEPVTPQICICGLSLLRGLHLLLCGAVADEAGLEETRSS